MEFSMQSFDFWGEVGRLPKSIPNDNLKRDVGVCCQPENVSAADGVLRSLRFSE